MIAGTEDRQHVYVALTRGTHDNRAYVFALSPKRADPTPGPGPAPELARYDRLTGEPGDRGPKPEAGDAKDPLGVLVEVLDRDGEQQSASRTRQRALSDADHLAVLHAIWTAETTPPASSGTRSCSRPRSRQGTGRKPATRRNGCGARCARRNWPAWTPARCSPTRSASGT